MKHLAAVTLLALAAACTPPQQQAVSAGFTAPYEIFEGERALELTEQCSRPSPGPVEAAWTPTAADIAALEPTLATRLASELAAKNSDADARAYIRQYGGLVIGGQRTIYVHGFRLPYEDPDEGWRTHARIICDGGEITFGVEYNPQTRAFANFAFNGPAL